MGEEISDKMLVTKVLISLPENMKHFVSAWESTPSDKQTLTDLTSRLMIEEERNKTSEDSMALAVKAKFIKPKVLVGKNNAGACNWWMDSGATEHMCFDKGQFTSMDHIPQERRVRVGNGTLVEVKGIGTVQVEAWNGNSWVRTDLINTLFVPDLDINLFSLSTALDKNFEMHSDKNKCELLDKNGKVVAIAERLGKLYKMKFKIRKQEREIQYSQVNAVSSLKECHQKLCHINFDQVEKVLNRNNVLFKKEQKPFCIACLGGKQHRLSFPISNSRATKTFELIHGDLCGPFEVPTFSRWSKIFSTIKR
ncbi:GAG-pre-integrase domain [Popillia japonica]|uniref:GAG-pre-integrase domain n=1 Tax=Popillia japonica TaxID=7064 RepID=A0AAW1JT24_POPJA